MAGSFSRKTATEKQGMIMKLELTSISNQSVGPKIHDIIQYLYNAINPSRIYQERRKTWGNLLVKYNKGVKKLTWHH